MSKLSNKIALVAVVATVIVVVLGATAVYAAFNSSNYTQSHMDSDAITNTECTACHGQMANEASLDPLTFSAHKKHLKSAFLRFQVMPNGCGTCHADTDIEQGSGATVNKQVDAALCASCHGVFPASLHGGENLAVTSPRGCTACHTDPGTDHAGVAYVNQFFVLSKTYCTKCHGGLPFYAAEETN